MRALTKDVSNKAPSPQSAKMSNDVSPTARSTPWQALHQTLGNQGVQRLLRTRAIQAKLRVSRHDDAYEQEADRVAKQVLQRKVAPCSCGGVCQTCRGQKPLQIQRRAEPGADDAGLSVPDNFLHSLGRGQPMDAGTRAFLEPRFGRDLGAIRIHRDSAAARAAQAVNARAFTVGNDLVFGPGEYAPVTDHGRSLLAHELVHTFQQRPRNPGGEAFLQRFSLWESAARFFGGGTFSDDELQAYLRLLDQRRSAPLRIEDDFDSDNKAREVVQRWKRGDSLYVLTGSRKIQLIEEMLSGFTGDDDENAILDLLTGSTGPEFAEILRQVGESRLRDDFHGAEYTRLESLLASRAPAPGARRPPAAGASTETFPSQTVLEAQQLFSSNAQLAHDVRQNCIEIVRTIGPRLFSHDPQMAGRVTTGLGRLSGGTLTMPHAGGVLTGLGAATGPTDVRFNNGNGNNEPTAMLASAWDTIIGLVGSENGWHIFGLAVFDGYHSITVFVDKRPDATRVYWADQWAIDPGDDFHQAPGSVSGFRRYEQTGFDRFITEKTREWWNDVHRPGSKCGLAHPRTWDRSCRYTATLKIWKFHPSPP